ncbi:MAG TPA: hypothetical protein VE861_13410, partial [Gemmatimonadaceae bacterium]|nr:hypothetical protein [Gemmatimonadaceae bacterium]
ADGSRTRSEHTWADWQHSNAHNAAVRVCRRCGELEVKAHDMATMTGLTPEPRGSVPIVDDAAVADLLARAQAQAAPASAPPRDARLVGQWRHTNSMSGGGFSLVTDTHLALDAQGRFARWTHSASGMGENTSEPFRGTWSTSGNELLLLYDDGDEGRSRYEVHDRELLMADWSSQKFWERTR